MVLPIISGMFGVFTHLIKIKTSSLWAGKPKTPGPKLWLSVRRRGGISFFHYGSIAQKTRDGQFLSLVVLSIRLLQGCVLKSKYSGLPRGRDTLGGGVSVHVSQV
jgi:hypothetical protein